MSSLREQTVAIWKVLVSMAQKREEPITYGELSKKLDLGLPRGMGRRLDPIYFFCCWEKIPVLTDLVVSKTTGLPSNRLGITLDRFEELKADIYAFDWTDELLTDLDTFIFC